MNAIPVEVVATDDSPKSVAETASKLIGVSAKAKENGELSPCCTVIKNPLDDEKSKLIAYLTEDNGRTRILIPHEVELPVDIDSSTLRNAVIIPAVT